MKRKFIALLLSAFVLPGLGQLYLGRKIKGIAILMITNLLMLMALFVLMKGLSPVIAAKIASGSIIGANEVLAGLHGVSGFAKALLAAFGLMWAYAIIDILTVRDDA
jgi:TM2 domain-containing membrane protein YozV